MKIKKLFKKQIALNKYKTTDKKIIMNHIYLSNLFGKNHEIVLLNLHYMHCEKRCYNRIKKL